MPFNIPHRCFYIILQLSANDFRVTTKGKKQLHYKKLKQIWYFNVINIAECRCVIGCTSEGSVIKFKCVTSRCYLFQNGSVWFMGNLLCLCDMWKGRSYENVNVSVSSIFSNGQFYLKYYVFRHRNSSSKRFS